MRLEVVIPFRAWSKGDVIPDVPPGLARELIARNLCIEEAAKAVRSPMDRMMRRNKVVRK